MFQKIILKIIDIIDRKSKLKIIKCIKKFFNYEIGIVFDVGAHKGETVKLFNNNFNTKNIFCFEPNITSFQILKNVTKKYKNNININNFALGENSGEKNLKDTIESSSSTFNEINTDSKYFKKKKLILGIFNNESYFNNQTVKIITASDFIDENQINKIDILKIDTEGYEYQVLKGFGDKLNLVNLILFEHHYDDMIKKSYTFSNINEILIKNNFKKIYKNKMTFRKSFEYIYKNNKF